MKNKVLRAAVVGAIAVTIIFSLSACNKKSGEMKKPSKSKVAEQKEKAFNAYKKILTENEAKIKAYTWQTVPGESTYGNSGLQRQVALCDIDGDKIPELFFFTADSNYHATLHIYRFDGKSAVELNYGGFDGQHDNGKFSDAEVAAGYSYVLYKGKAPNTFYLYYSIGDMSMTYTVNKYAFKDNAIKLEETLVNKVTPAIGNNASSDVYKINGKEISFGDGTKAFRKTFEEIDKTIIFSSFRNEGDTISLWKRVGFDKALCVSYDSAIEVLSK